MAVDRVLEVLQRRFGLEAFRGPQREIIDHLLAGGNALVIMPTGSGKSLVYQVPALLVEGRTVVLSPLIALMKDQVDALRRRGIPASFVNSSLDRGERERRLAAFVDGSVRLLYVTPERFRSPRFREALARVPVALLAVDEAHCATEWGHDFRPDYSRIAGIRELLGNPPTAALTATATPAVQAEILRLVGIPDARLFHTGIERPNLFLAVSEYLDEQEKWRRVEELWRALPGAAIVYGALIKDLQRLEEHLAAAGLRAVVYHGGLSAEERRCMQERFMSGAAPRVLATNAFGMGVDKADIRGILHHQVPGSVEAYWQEIGRAGRDGLPSYCELLYQQEDLAIQTQFVEWSNPDAALLREVAHVLGEAGGVPDRADLQRRVRGRPGHDGRIETCLQWLDVLGVTEGNLEQRTLRVVRPLEDREIPASFAPAKRERDLTRLLRVVEYVKAEGCRRRWLAEYFGLPPGPPDCGACDRCTDREAWRRAALAGVPSVAVPPEAPRLERGAFVRVDGRLLGRVVRVSGQGRRRRVEVELSSSLEVRSFDLSRHAFEVLSG